MTANPISFEFSRVSLGRVYSTVCLISFEVTYRKTRENSNEIGLAVMGCNNSRELSLDSKMMQTL